MEPPKPEPGSAWGQSQAPAQVQPLSSLGAPNSRQAGNPTSNVEVQVPPLKRPALPTCSYEGLEDDDLAMESLYDYSSLNAWLQHPVKKFKPGVKLEPCRRGSRGSVGGMNDVTGLPSPSSNVVSIKREPLTPQMVMDGDGVAASPKPTDPYEFVDDFPTTVSMAGFKIKNETTKEDDKTSRESNSQQAFTNIQVVESAPPSTPNATTGSTSASVQPSVKETKNSVSLDSIGSPLTPKTQNANIGFLRDSDLVPRLKDLDQLFDTSDDDTNDDPTDTAVGLNFEIIIRFS